MTMRVVFLLLGGANIGYDDLLSYLDACIMLFVLDARLVIVVWLRLWYVCFLELDMGMALCVFTHV
jgi:hypothetical protein